MYNYTQNWLILQSPPLTHHNSELPLSALPNRDAVYRRYEAFTLPNFYIKKDLYNNMDKIYSIREDYVTCGTSLWLFPKALQMSWLSDIANGAVATGNKSVVRLYNPNYIVWYGLAGSP